MTRDPSATDRDIEHEALVLPLSDGALRLDEHNTLLRQRFDEDRLPKDWQVETGCWTPTPDGLIGSIEQDKAAVIWCPRRFPDELALVLEAQALPGHDNDANAFFRAAGSIYGAGPCPAWIAGCAGWYVHDHGLEHHPAGPTLRVPGEPLAPGRTVRLVAGWRAGRVFLWKDGTLLLERQDPVGNDRAPHDRLGLGTWNSAIRFLSLWVHHIGSQTP